jgi:hypothetical protein
MNWHPSLSGVLVTILVVAGCVLAAMMIEKGS